MTKKDIKKIKEWFDKGQHAFAYYGEYVCYIDKLLDFIKTLVKEDKK